MLRSAELLERETFMRGLSAWPGEYSSTINRTLSMVGLMDRRLRVCIRDLKAATERENLPPFLPHADLSMLRHADSESEEDAESESPYGISLEASQAVYQQHQQQQQHLDNDDAHLAAMESVRSDQESRDADSDSPQGSELPPIPHRS